MPVSGCNMGMAELIIGIGKKKPKMGMPMMEKGEDEETEYEGDEEAEMEAASEILAAIKKGDAKALSEALKTMMHLCE